MQTQENLSKPDPSKQTFLTLLNGNKFWADNELIPLLVALNKAGLITRSHCSGHGEGPSWVVIQSSNILGVEIRKDETYNEIVLTWDPKP